MTSDRTSDAFHVILGSFYSMTTGLGGTLGIGGFIGFGLEYLGILQNVLVSISNLLWFYFNHNHVRVGIPPVGKSHWWWLPP